MNKYAHGWFLVLCLFVQGFLFHFGCSKPIDIGMEKPHIDAGRMIDGVHVEKGFEDQAKKPRKKKNKSALLFEPKKVIEINIEIAVKDWDFIRKQKRNYNNLLDPNCQAAPFESIFEYRKAKVTVDGQVFKDVGVRKKGLVGSIHSVKPSLKLKFDKFVKGQEIYSLERMTLNNNKADPSFMRQCLSYRIFAKAGIPAPRCNFAHVKINGKTLGLFTHVESVKKRFLARHYDDNDGNLYEGTLSDFREGWVGTFQQKTNKKSPIRKTLQAVVSALKEPNNKLEKALAPFIHMEAFYTFWALEVLVHHGDGYAGNMNNFYVYLEPIKKRLEFIPWGVDATFSRRARFAKAAPLNVFARGILTRRLYLYDKTRKKYTNAMQKLLNTFWKENEIIKDIDDMEKMLFPFVAKDYFSILRMKKSWSFKQEVKFLRQFVKARRKELQRVIDNPPAWNLPKPSKICFERIGKMNGTFQTSFGNLKSQNPFLEGGGTLMGDFLGKLVKPSNVNAVSGLDDKEKSLVRVSVVAQVSKTDFFVASLGLNKSIVQKQVSLPLRNLFSGNKTVLGKFDAKTKKFSILGALWKGSIHFDKIEFEKGKPVVGRFSVEWIQRSKVNAEACYFQCLKSGGKSNACNKKCSIP